MERGVRGEKTDATVCCKGVSIKPQVVVDNVRGCFRFDVLEVLKSMFDQQGQWGRNEGTFLRDLFVCCDQ